MNKNKFLNNRLYKTLTPIILTGIFVLSFFWQISSVNYLNTGNKYSVKELSEKIGITERMIRYYKLELEQASITIETFMRPNG